MIIGATILLVSAYALTAEEPYSTSPFNTSAASLPRGYRGHDAKRLYASLRGRVVRKSEFETTGRYAERVISSSGLKLYGGITGQSKLAVQVRCYPSYDADSSVMTVSIKASDSAFLTYHADTRSRGSYVGQNGFGVKRRVYRGESTTYELLALSLDDFLDFGYSKADTLTFSFRTTSASAKSLKPALRVLTVFTTQYPFTDYSVSYDTPTMDSPYEVTYRRNFVFGDVLEFWLYDVRSGKVYGKALRGKRATSATSATAPTGGRSAVGKLGQLKVKTPIHVKPNKGSRVLYQGPAQLYVVMAGIADGWATIVMADGSYGYVDANAVEALPYDVNVKQPRGRSASGNPSVTLPKPSVVPDDLGPATSDEIFVGAIADLSLKRIAMVLRKTETIGNLDGGHVIRGIRLKQEPDFTTVTNWDDIRRFIARWKTVDEFIVRGVDKNGADFLCVVTARR